MIVRKQFMISYHERMLLDPAGLEPANFWSPVRRESNWATEATPVRLELIHADSEGANHPTHGSGFLPQLFAYWDTFDYQRIVNAREWDCVGAQGGVGSWREYRSRPHSDMNRNMRNMSQSTINPTIRPVWPAKTQISLYIHPVWQEFSFILFWIAWRL